LRLFPSAFEFSPRLLLLIAHHAYSCRFGTFLYNCERERVHAGLPYKTPSLWGYILARAPAYANPAYAGRSGADILLPHPASVLRQVSLWSEWFLRYSPFPSLPSCCSHDNAPPGSDRYPRDRYDHHTLPAGPHPPAASAAVTAAAAGAVPSAKGAAPIAASSTAAAAAPPAPALAVDPLTGTAVALPAAGSAPLPQSRLPAAPEQPMSTDVQAPAAAAAAATATQAAATPATTASAAVLQPSPPTSPTEAEEGRRQQLESEDAFPPSSSLLDGAPAAAAVLGLSSADGDDASMPASFLPSQDGPGDDHDTDDEAEP
jgi:hypothetical protein